MESIIVLATGTALCLIRAIAKRENRDTYLVTAVVFLILIGSHTIFNPTL